MTVKIIVAVSISGIIGLNNGIPWRKSADLKRFKSVTMGGTLVMGRKTFDSMGRRLLPGRTSIVISRSIQDGVSSSSSVGHAIAMGEAKGDPVWVIGGGEIYNMALPLTDEVDLTVVTDYECPAEGSGEVTYFSHFKDGMPGFKLQSEEQNADDPTLVHRRYVRV